jgi:5-methylthioadenosine/S-adenosylhomocysteine deaminase
MLGPYSADVCTPLFLARTAAVALRLGCGIHIGVAETPDQVARSLDQYDLTPIEILDRNGVFDVPALVAHAIWLSEPDRLMLAARGAGVVQCPGYHMRLGLGVTPVPELLAVGVNVGLGSGSPAGAHSISMLRAARQAALLSKLHLVSAEALPGDRALRLATQGAARAMGFPACGVIESGRPADLIMVHCRAPRLAWQPDPVAALLYAAEDADISDLMVAGRWLMRRRQLVTLDEERILREAARHGRDLLHRAAMAEEPAWTLPRYGGR